MRGDRGGPIHAPLVMLLLLAAGIAVHVAVPAARVIDVASAGVGTVLTLSGVGLMAWALRLRVADDASGGRIGVVRALVEEGPYQFTRNPIYVSLTVLLAGLGFFLGSLPALLMPGIFLLVMDLAVVPWEEERLERRFGPAWLDYRARVRRWI